VSTLPGRDIGKGSFTYTFTVDQMSFAPEVTFKEPQLKLNEQVQKLEAGKVYRIAVRGKGFEPDVEVFDGVKSVLRRLNNGKRVSAGGALPFFEAVGLAKAEFETSLTLVAARTTDYRIVIAVGPFSAPGSARLPYTVQITEQKIHLSVSDQLTAKDPLYMKGGAHKTHMVKLDKGKDYQIDLITSAFDSRLVLEDSTGKVVAQGVDAEGLNSRLVVHPTKTDTYRIVATTNAFNATGAYVVTVVESLDAAPGLPSLKK
jgi:hypothetical protein